MRYITDVDSPMILEPESPTRETVEVDFKDGCYVFSTKKPTGDIEFLITSRGLEVLRDTLPIGDTDIGYETLSGNKYLEHQILAYGFRQKTSNAN